MEKRNIHHDVEKAKMYKDLYRPSVSLSRFLKTIWGIVLMGDSPISNRYHYPVRKKN